MRPSPLLLVAVLFLGLIPPAPADAGSTYRGPNGAVPPGLREPYDPAPPPPPPPVAPGVSHPTFPPTTPAPPPVDRPFGHRHPVLSFEQWLFGWHQLHQDVILLISPARHFGDGIEEDPVRTAALEAMRAAAAPDADVHPAVAASALLALGRSTEDPADAELLYAALAPHRGTHQIVREGAAFGLGLLRERNGTRRFPTPQTPRAREALLTVVENDAEPSRLRGIAAAGVGLLASDPNGDPADTAGRLGAILQRLPPNQDVGVGALLALGRLGSMAPLPGETLATIRALAYPDEAGRGTTRVPLRATALHALATAGSAEDVGRMAGLLADRRSGVALRRSAALALGTLACRYAGAQRSTIARILVHAHHSEKDTTVRGFLLDSLAFLIAWGDVEGPDGVRARDVVLRTTDAGELLLTQAATASWSEGGWAALGLGLLLRARGEPTGLLGGPALPPDLAGFRDRALAVLDAGGETQSEPVVRSAYVLGGALARGWDSDHNAALCALALDKRQPGRVRAYATLGLGLCGGDRSGAALDVIRSNLDQRTSEELRLLATQAAGSFGDMAPVEALARELTEARYAGRKAAAAAALARSGSRAAAEALLVAAASEKAIVRASALDGLGLLFEQHYLPWQMRLLLRANYRASSSLHEVLTSMP